MRYPISVELGSQVSTPVTEEVAIAMTRAAIKAGITTLDTARIYR